MSIIQTNKEKIKIMKDIKKNSDYKPTISEKINHITSVLKFIIKNEEK